VEERSASVSEVLTPVSTYQIARCHKPEYHNLNLALLHLIWNEATGEYRDMKKQGTAKLNHSCVHNPILSCAAIQPSPVQITNQIIGYIMVGHC
jgi:hypothetical protein